MIESIFFNPWVWIIPIILLACILGVALGLWEYEFEVLAFLGGGILLVLVPIYFAWALPPYDVSFYQTYRVTGEVVTLERAFTGDEGGTLSNTFVVEVDGLDHLITSDDQRFRTVSVGDDVNLVCEKRFQYFVEPWYSCSFGGR